MNVTPELLPKANFPFPPRTVVLARHTRLTKHNDRWVRDVFLCRRSKGEFSYVCESATYKEAMPLAGNGHLENTTGEPPFNVVQWLWQVEYNYGPSDVRTLVNMVCSMLERPCKLPQCDAKCSTNNCTLCRLEYEYKKSINLAKE